jgi:hypothetical protein
MTFSASEKLGGWLQYPDIKVVVSNSQNPPIGGASAAKIRYRFILPLPRFAKHSRFRANANYVNLFVLTGGISIAPGPLQHERLPAARLIPKRPCWK